MTNNLASIKIKAGIFTFQSKIKLTRSYKQKASQLTLEGFVEGKELRVPKKNRTPIYFKQLFFEKKSPYFNN
jgi:hypothetical protein